jgi:hypothetical protein
MFFDNYVAVDITNAEIKVLAARGNKVVKWYSTPVPDDVVKAGIIREPQAMGVILDNLFNTLKLSRDHVICSVTGLPFIYRTLRMPGTERISNEAIEREARREMSLSTEDMFLAWQAADTHPETKELDYFVVGVPRTALSSLVETLTKARIKPYLIDVKPLALARAVSLPNALIVSLEKDYFDVVVVASGLVRVIHSINPSGKSGDVFGLVNEVEDALNKAVKSFERDFPGMSLPADTPILLAGKFTADSRLPLMVQEGTRRQVKTIAANIPAPSALPVEQYAGALGLLGKKVARRRQPTVYRDINLNLFAGLKRENTPKFQLAYAITAVVCLILAALVYETFELKKSADDQVISLQQKADAVTQKLQAAQQANKQKVADNQSMAAKFQAVSQQLAVMRASNAVVNGQRIDFAARIVEINQALSAGVQIKTMEIQLKNITLSGLAENAFTVMTLADELEKSVYFLSARVEQLSPAKDQGVTFQISIVNKPDSEIN